MIHLHLVKRWHRYWFDDGGRLALAVIRIAVATSVLMILVELSRLPQLVAPSAVYRPIGIWMLFGHSPPPEWLVVILWALAGASTVAMLLGVHARASTAISFASALAITSLYYSGMAAWSHSHNVTFLAQLALLGGRCGDTLSVDALRRGPIHVQHGYQWSVRLVQIAVGLMFVTACFHKLRSGGFTLAWATSDNLRHQLLARFDLVNMERPAMVDWLLAESWRYRGAAMLNLVSQAAPLLAIVFVRRPWVRAVVAVMFLVEGIVIDQLLGLPNWQWLPLAAVFVDWDYFLRRPQPPVTHAPPRKRGIYVFVVAFTLYYLVTATVPKIDQRLNTYPFSAFQMFAVIRSAKPYSEHRPYVMYGDHYETDVAIDEQAFDHEHRFMYLVTDPAKLRARLETIKPAGATKLTHWLSMFVAEAYPAPAELQRRPLAITGELTPEGFRTVLGRASGTTVELRPQNVDVSGGGAIYYIAEQRTEPIRIEATHRGNTFTLKSPIPPEADHVIVVINAMPWLVWSKRHR